MIKNLGFTKKAKLTVSDIEDHIGTYFSDATEPRVRTLISNEYSKRLPLRHPVATGIPTLGIAPAVSKSLATKAITNTLARENESIAKAYKQQQILNMLKKLQATQMAAYAGSNLY